MEDLELWLRGELQRGHGHSKKQKRVRKELVCPYSQSGSLEQLKSRKKPKHRPKHTGTLPSLRSPHEFSKDDLATKTITLPYADNYLLVEESLRMINDWSPQSRDFLAANDLASTLVKRYPRFCEGLNFNQDRLRYKIRSDLWLVRIIEEAYDAASSECTKHVSSVRARQRYNLDLGAMDSFPQSVRRYISQKYSVLNILPQICMEILLAISRVTSVSGEVCMHRQVDEATVCDSGRVFLFSAFLSEELDVDRLAAYLQVREIAQEAAGFQFKDVIAHMQHPVTHGLPQSPTRPAAAEREEPDLVDLLDASKICPLKLPFHLRTMKDASMPEAPLLAVDLRTLSVICHRATPHCPPGSRKYLSDKILFWVATLIHRKSSIFRLLEFLKEDNISFSETQFEGALVDGLRVVPAHVIVWAVCAEFGYFKGGQQVSVAEALHGDGPKEAVTSDQGLAVLNRLYDNDRALLNGLDSDITQAELSFSQWKTKILDLEKQKRKIERKWKDFQPDFHLRGSQAVAAEENKGYDLKELSRIKMTLLEAEEGRSSAESLVRRLKKKRASLNSDIDSLWDTTLSGGTTQRKAAGLKKGRLDWRDVILTRISDAINSNFSFHRDALAVEMASRPRPPLSSAPQVPEVNQTQKLGQENDFKAQDEVQATGSIYDQIAAIEAEARELASIGSAFLLTPEPKLEPEPEVALDSLSSDQTAVLSRGWSIAQWVLARTMAACLVSALLRDPHRSLASVPRDRDPSPTQSSLTISPDEPAVDPASVELFHFPRSPLSPPRNANEAVLNLGNFFFEDEELERVTDTYLERQKTKAILGFLDALRRRRNTTRVLLRWRQTISRRSMDTLRGHSSSRRAQRIRTESLLKAYLLGKQLHQMKKGLGSWRCSVAHQKALKECSILRIQCAGRKFLAIVRVRKLRIARERLEKAVQDSLVNSERLSLQRAVARLLWWKTRRQTLRQAALRVRCRRLSPQFGLWRKLFAQIRLSYAIRQSLARRELMARRQKAIRMGEYCVAIPSILEKNRTRRLFQHWRLFKTVSTIFRLSYRKALNTKLTRSMQRWKTATSLSVASRERMATKIQSCYRMHLSLQHKMNFFVTRRGMVALQCIVRKRIATEVVALARKRHLSAISLQRMIRGYTFRIQLRRKRIQDIHEAVKANNYDRLLHYCDCFYNLTFQLDQEGNTALHNAAKYASKRCIKLLMKYYHDPSVTNPEGYTPLHLLIMSAAPARDEVFEYMIEVGFDEEQLTSDGKNALLLAAEYGRIRIANQCLKEGQNPNQTSSDGSTPLQFACRHGYEPLVKSLLEFGADPNLPGSGGLYPLHDVTYSGSVAIAQALIAAGASLEVFESLSGWTPLMMACRSGLEDLVDVFLAQAPDVKALDYSWCNAAHHSAVSNSIRIANSLREAEVDFYALDYEGNSPLHYAAQYGSVDIMREFLYSGAPASLQNKHGNQPSHIAAQYNQVECLRLLSRYDQHMGRMNYQHQTPLGMAKFHLARESQRFLEEYFSKIDSEDVRNKDGDIWWDREIDARLGDWQQVIDEANHRHFVNVVTGEISLDPPAISTATVLQIAEYAQVPMKMKVLPQDEENRLNRNVYQTEYLKTQHSIDDARKLFGAATVITKFARRKLAYRILANKRLAVRRLQVLGRFVRRATDVLTKWKIIARTKKWIRVQALFRGYSSRCHFYYWDGTYQELWYGLAKRRLARTIWNLWRNYKLQLLQTTVHVAATAPRLLSEWEKVLDQAGYPLRVVGLYEEYLYPGTKKIFFFRNIETGVISFHKPKEIEKKDLMEFRSRQMLIERGYTPAQLKLALKLQALWRGHKIRNMYVFISKATSICVHAESRFLSEPDSDRNLFNYTLYCHVVLHDYDRARPLYLEAMRRMTFKGPDVAQILYAYAIFSFVVHDEDVEECLHLVSRAREAEVLHYNLIRKQQQRATELSGGKESSGGYVNIEITTGKAFELATVGFFRYMCNLQGSSEAFHNYAACRFLVYSDFPGAFEAFMGAFKTEPMNFKLRENYNAMMLHFFGRNQNLIDEEVNRRMRILADKDLQEKLARQERIDLWNHKIECASSIQKWYRHHRDLIKFRAIVDKLRRKKKNSSMGR